MVSHIQALLFKKEFFNTKQANAFLKRNNFKKIKPFDITNTYLRARLITPNNKRFIYRIGSISPKIDVIYEISK